MRVVATLRSLDEERGLVLQDFGCPIFLCEEQSTAAGVRLHGAAGGACKHVTAVIRGTDVGHCLAM